MYVNGINSNENHLKEVNKDKNYENVQPPEIKIKEEIESEGIYNPSNDKIQESEIKEGMIIVKDDQVAQNHLLSGFNKNIFSVDNMDFDIINGSKINDSIKREEKNNTVCFKVPENEIKEEGIYKMDDRPINNDPMTSDITESSDCELHNKTMKEITDNCTIVPNTHKLCNDPAEDNYCYLLDSRDIDVDCSPSPFPVSKGDCNKDLKLLQNPIVLLVDFKYNNEQPKRGIQHGIVNQAIDDGFIGKKRQKAVSSTVAEYDLNFYKNSDDKNKFFRCFLCSFKTVYYQRLISHQLVHSNNRSFQCNQCEYKAKRKCDLKVHILLHDPTNSYDCNFCSYKGTTQKNLTNHMLKHTNPYSFKCYLCGKFFTLKGNLTTHVKLIHEEPKHIFNCEFCNFKTIRKSTVTLHINTVHKKTQIFKCTSCSYSTARKGDLSRHVMAHTGIKPYGCSQCSFKCTNSGSLTLHIRTHTGERPFKCILCDKSFKTKTTLNEHMDVHKESKPFQCPICDYASTSKKKLNSHLVCHTDKKTYKCPSCNYTSKNSQGLKHHMKIHSGKFLNCKLCDYKTPFIFNMRSHMNTHEGVKPFKCDMCDYAGRSKQHLERHLESEHYEHKSKKICKPKDRSFPCDVCSFVGASFGYLRNHLKLKHEIRI